jgi:hypothetical protein
MAEFHIHVEAIITTQDGEDAPTLLEAASAIVMGLETTMNIPVDDSGVPVEESGNPVARQAGNHPVTALGLEIDAGNPEGTVDAKITIQTHEVEPGTDDIVNPTTGKPRTGDAEW